MTGKGIVFPPPAGQNIVTAFCERVFSSPVRTTPESQKCGSGVVLRRRQHFAFCVPSFSGQYRRFSDHTIFKQIVRRKSWGKICFSQTGPTHLPEISLERRTKNGTSPRAQSSPFAGCSSGADRSPGSAAASGVPLCELHCRFSHPGATVPIGGPFCR